MTGLQGNHEGADVKLSRKEAAALAQLEDEAIKAASRGPMLDEEKAIRILTASLRQAAGEGQSWAAAVLDDCLEEGAAEMMKDYSAEQDCRDEVVTPLRGVHRRRPGR